jgi:serine/threonine protein kinase
MAHPMIHPHEDQLAAYSLGKLDDAEMEAVAEHLETCDACRQTVEETPPDKFVAALQGARQGSDPAVPPELANHPRFHVVRELGRGGMGVVYLAEQHLMERPVAIKVISKSLMDNPKAVERFRGEVRAAAKLDHKNIVRVWDADQAGNLQMLVMEYVEGLSLAEVLERKGPLPVAQACQYVQQAALALQHAFEQGMVHRDLKPHNLMLLPANGLVKVLDFGLAKVASEQRQGKGVTAENTVMGTPEYLAPEQATDPRTADIRADIYSLGCTLYCLLAGRPPFVEPTAMQTVLAHRDKQAVMLHERRADVPPELSAVVARMLAKDPAQRYQTPQEVADALAPFCLSSPRNKATVRTKDKQAQRRRALARRRWRTMGLVALAVILGLELTLVITRLNIEAKVNVAIKTCKRFFYNEQRG